MDLFDGEAPRGGSREGSDEKKQQRKFSASSAGIKAQQQRILRALRLRSQTSNDLRGEPVGSYQNPTRIHELRKQGYVIETSRVVIVDAAGFVHPNVALYTLVSEPDAAETLTRAGNRPVAPSGATAEAA